jgi:hypothetical protein
MVVPSFDYLDAGFVVGSLALIYLAAKIGPRG